MEYNTKIIDFLMNPWIITVIGGLLVIIIAKFTIDRINSKKSRGVENSNQKQEQYVTVHNNIGYNNTPVITTEDKEPLDETDILSLKAKTKILFIEDDVFKKISNLKKLGWNITQIKNITNPDMEAIRTAHIIFVDYKGVGENFSDEQGLGLIKILRNRYMKSKWLILYSAHSFDLNIFDLGADSYLSKNSAVYEIEQKIIQGAKIVVK